VIIRKCSEPTCNTHKGFNNLDDFDPYGSVRPVPEVWACNWHTDPPHGSPDPRSPIARRSAQLAASAPAGS
jgi:hypothetical protein